MRRFLVPPEAVAGDRVTVTGSEAHHLAAVLRLRPGDRIVAFDGSDREYVVELEAVGPAQATGRIVAVQPGVRPAIALTLVQGLPRGAKMDDVIRMGTELGVAEFIPLRAARAVAESRQKVARWRRIAGQAAKQCRRSDVPAVAEPMTLSDALARIGGSDLILLLWEGERQRSIAAALADAGSARRVALLVGPEGGFAPAEVDLAVRAGAVPVSLGPLVLRTETAGVAAAAMVLYELTLRRMS